MYTLLITFFLVAIIFSFLCSLWESVLLSITPSYARIKLEEGTKLGKHLQHFKVNIDQPLAAILTLNTIAHTMGAVGVGDQAASIWHETNPLITNLLVPVVMTLAILVLSEIIPKTIGASYWKELAGFTVSSLLIIIYLLYPLVWMSQFLTRILKKDKDMNILTRSDFVAMAEIGEQDGVFEKQEANIISNLIQFNTVQAKDIMTPRTVVKTAPEDMKIKEFYETNTDLRHSRIPVYQKGQIDDITGYILKDVMLASILEGNGEQAISTIKREIAVVNEHFPIPDLFNYFLEKREHIALVADDYGGMAGIVTMEDVIETLLGMEIIDELDKTTDMQMLARRVWDRRAKKIGLITDDDDKQSIEEK